MMLQISVIICTHNPREVYLRRTLEALEIQTLPKKHWELLIVDNASDEPLAKSWDLSWHSNARHIRENELGLTSARLCGIVESKGGMLVFVDDDNILPPNYLERALLIQQKFPFVSVFGAGMIEPEFEITPPRELQPFLSMLALREVRDAVWSNNTLDSQSIPWGAGLCVMQDVAEAYLRMVQKLNATAVIDRRGQQLFCGGDDLFSWVAARNGRGFGVFPELKIKHIIYASRLTRSYFLRLLRDHSFSHSILRYLVTATNPRAPRLVERLRFVLHGLRNGWFSMRCQMASGKGASGAVDFIRKNKLQPIEAGQPL